MKQTNFPRTLGATLISSCLLLLGSFGLMAEESPEAGADKSPIQVIEQTAEGLQEALAGRQDYYKENTEELYALIDRILLPNFDITYAGKQVLGKKHWLASSEEQRNRFIDAFSNFLIKTYATGILEFDQDKMTIDTEPKYSKDGKKALISTELILDGADNVQINYAARAVGGGWKIYDVRIEGVSYIQNYRNQFNAEINAQGLDTVIARLESEAAAAEQRNAEDVLIEETTDAAAAGEAEES
jgi:phospholipid transport system substrate-binding protein